MKNLFLFLFLIFTTFSSQALSHESEVDVDPCGGSNADCPHHFRFLLSSLYEGEVDFYDIEKKVSHNGKHLCNNKVNIWNIDKNDARRIATGCVNNEIAKKAKQEKAEREEKERKMEAERKRLEWISEQTYEDQKILSCTGNSCPSLP